MIFICQFVNLCVSIYLSKAGGGWNLVGSPSKAVLERELNVGKVFCTIRAIKTSNINL